MIIDTGTFQALTLEVEVQRAVRARFDALADEAGQQLDSCRRILARPHTAAAASARRLAGPLASLAAALKDAAAGCYLFEQVLREGIQIAAVQEEAVLRGQRRTAGRHPGGGGRHARPRGQRPGHLSLVQGGGQ
jgi:hypothetical protein